MVHKLAQQSFQKKTSKNVWPWQEENFLPLFSFSVSLSHTQCILSGPISRQVKSKAPGIWFKKISYMSMGWKRPGLAAIHAKTPGGFSWPQAHPS